MKSNGKTAKIMRENREKGESDGCERKRDMEKGEERQRRRSETYSTSGREMGEEGVSLDEREEEELLLALEQGLEERRRMSGGERGRGGAGEKQEEGKAEKVGESIGG